MKTPMTEEQKAWFLYGYVKALSQALADDLEITEDEARNILIEGVKAKRGVK